MATFVTWVVMLLGVGPTPSPLAQAESNALARVTEVGYLLKGRVLGSCITRGMTDDQVLAILGGPDMIAGGIGGFMEVYDDLGVVVFYYSPVIAAKPHRVEEVRFTAF